MNIAHLYLRLVASLLLIIITFSMILPVTISGNSEFLIVGYLWAFVGLPFLLYYINLPTIKYIFSNDGETK